MGRGQYTQADKHTHTQKQPPKNEDFVDKSQGQSKTSRGKSNKLWRTERRTKIVECAKAEKPGDKERERETQIKLRFMSPLMCV